MKKILICHHKEDNDGMFSAAIMTYYIKQNNSDVTIEYLPMDYNTATEISHDQYTLNQKFLGYDCICMLDFSFPNSVMMYLHDVYGPNFIWIDHHRPIIEKSISEGFDDIGGLRGFSYSTLALTYFWTHPLLEQVPENLPKLYLYLNAYDSWTFEKRNIDFDICNAVNVGVEDETDLDIDKTLSIVNDIENGYIDNDTAILKYQKLGQAKIAYRDKENVEIINKFGDSEWTVNGERAMCVVWSVGSYSKMFKSVEGTDIKHGIVCKRNRDNTWVISLYNVGEQSMHCGEYLAKHYAGGGHKGAAGCQVTSQKMFELFESKTL